MYRPIQSGAGTWILNGSRGKMQDKRNCWRRRHKFFTCIVKIEHADCMCFSEWGTCMGPACHRTYVVGYVQGQTPNRGEQGQVPKRFEDLAFIWVWKIKSRLDQWVNFHNLQSFRSGFYVVCSAFLQADHRNWTGTLCEVTGNHTDTFYTFLATGWMQYFRPCKQGINKYMLAISQAITYNITDGKGGRTG